MELKTILLQDLNIDLFRRSVKRAMFPKNEILNILIGPDTISGINSYETAFVKKWSILTTEICTFSEQFEPIKVSIFKGGAFVDRVLSIFEEKCNMEIEYMDGGATKITVYDDTFRLNFATAPVNLSYKEYSSNQINAIFNPDGDIIDFSLSAGELGGIINLTKKLDGFDVETQKTYVNLYTEGGLLCVSDGTFKKKLHPESVDIADVMISKHFLSLFCRESYKMRFVSDVTGQKFLVAESQDSDTVSSLVLVEEVQQDDSFDLGNTVYNWAND